MIEALASGTPVIGLDSGAISEVIRDGVNGFLIKKDDRRWKVDDKVESRKQKVERKILQIYKSTNNQLTNHRSLTTNLSAKGGPALGWKSQISNLSITESEEQIAEHIADAINNINQIDRKLCRENFENRFTLKRMALDYKNIYSKTILKSS